MCSCSNLMYKFILILFIYIVYGNDTSQSALPDSVKHYKHGEYLTFGIKTLSKTTVINPHLYLTLVLNTTQYQCQLNPVEAPSWPYIWYWCNMEHIATSYCENTDDEDDYSIIITNEADTAIFVDYISIVTEQGSISIDTFYGKSINKDYPSVRPEEYLIDPLGLVYGTIAIENMSILINLKTIIEKQAYNITIIENEITKCTSDVEAWFVLVVTPTRWHDAEKHCIDTYHTHLATIDSNISLQIVFEVSSQYGAPDAWIGLTYINSSWVWADGTSCGYADDGDCANDKHWQQFEPTEYSGELCVHVTDDYGYFNNNDCEMPFAFFCSIPSNASVSSLPLKTTAVPENLTNTKGLDNQITNGSSQEYDEIIWIVIGFVIIVIIAIFSYKYYCKDRRRDVQYETVSEQVTNSSSHVQFGYEHYTKSGDVGLSLETGKQTEITITPAPSVTNEMKDQSAVSHE